MDLRALYEIPGKTVVTAHRGWSGRYPENTLTAFDKAVEIGADIVELDVYECSDGGLAVIHDPTLDRTTNGSGPVSSHRLAELASLNATCWRGPHDTGYRSNEPAGSEGIPTLEEAIELVRGRAGMNIQVKAKSREAIGRIVELYARYGLYDSAFLMLDGFAEVELVRSIDPRVALCSGEARGELDRHLRYRMEFLQPTRDLVTEEFARRLREHHLRANVFYANTVEETETLLAMGVPGILTDCPDVVLETIRARARREGP